MSYVDRIARLRIELDDTKPVIWRTVEVPLTMSLAGLHEVIQVAMPFEDYHLYEFRAGATRYVKADPDFPDKATRSPKATRLGAVLETGIRRFAYTYDFGDNWQHTVIVEAVFDADPAAEYPRFLDGERRAPPEDVGGVPGLEEFLAILSKPRHREHKRMLEWCGGSYDPETLGLEAIQAGMSKLVRRRTMGKAGFAKSIGRLQ